MSAKRPSIRRWFKKKLPKLIRGICVKTPFTSAVHALWALANRKNYLKSTGWFESYRRRMPVDRAGQPIPWYTYAATAFLEPRIKPEMKIFEYGSGNSTLWWGRRTARVVSCEHDRAWHGKLKPSLPANVDYHWHELHPDGEYAKSLLSFGAVFDVVVIDGRDRVNCSRYAPQGLAPGGVILWDNSDREEYRIGYEFLVAAGFRRLDFSGMGPMSAKGWCTSVFYRSGNALGL